MKLRAVVSVYCLLFFSSASPALAITLKECVARSLENSQLVQAYENQIKFSIYNYKKQKTELLPQSTVNTGVEHVWYGAKSDLDPDTGYQGKVGIDMSMDLQKLLAWYPQLSQLEIEKSELLKTITKNLVRKETTQEYYKLYVLLKKKQDYTDVNSFFDEHIKDVEKILSKGVDVKLDLARAKVQQNSVRISASNVNAEIRNVLLSLNSKMLTQFKDSDFVSMKEPDLSDAGTTQTIFDESAPESDAENSYIERVEANYAKKIPDLYQSRLDAYEVKIAEETYRQSRLYYIPSLQFGAEHNYHTNDPNVEAYRVSLALTFNIFDFPQKEFEKRRAEYNYAYQKHVFKENQGKLKLQIDQLITDIENAQTTYKNAAANLEGIKEIIQSANSYYEQGKIKETDLINVSSEYLVAKEQYYEALTGYLSKKAELDFMLEGIKI